MSRTAVVLIATLAHVASCNRAEQARPGPESPALDSRDDSRVRCNDRRAWGSYLRSDTAATVADILAAIDEAGAAVPADRRAPLEQTLESLVKWRLIRFLIVEGENHNFGSLDLPAVTTAGGAPLRVFRTGFTNNPDQPGSCYDDLLTRGGVRHVVSLYAGVMPTRDLEAAEERAAREHGAEYFSVRSGPASFTSWRGDIDDHPDDDAVLRVAMEAVATLVNRHILRPGGRAPRGNVHVHCAGGMHRTSMIVGILDRCLNHTPMVRIEADYKRHVDWRGEDSPGGYEPGNLAFIRDFDCSLLQP